MKKYVNTIEQLLKFQHPDTECSCFSQFALDEEFLCDICLARLRQARQKVNRRSRINSKSKHNEYKE